MFYGTGTFVIEIPAYKTVDISSNRKIYLSVKKKDEVWFQHVFVYELFTLWFGWDSILNLSSFPMPSTRRRGARRNFLNTFPRLMHWRGRHRRPHPRIPSTAWAKNLPKRRGPRRNQDLWLRLRWQVRHSNGQLPPPLKNTADLEARPGPWVPAIPLLKSLPDSMELLAARPRRTLEGRRSAKIPPAPISSNSWSTIGFMRNIAIKPWKPVKTSSHCSCSCISLWHCRRSLPNCRSSLCSLCKISWGSRTSILYRSCHFRKRRIYPMPKWVKISWYRKDL